jgi:hypothetical protein
MDLNDRQWQIVMPLIPPDHSGPGRPSLDSRCLLDGVFWKIRSASPWRVLPACYPSHQSCQRFYSRAISLNFFGSIILRLYSDLLYRGGLTPFRAVAEHRIVLKDDGRSLQLFISPRYLDDWCTNTALLFMQLELQAIRKALLARPSTDRVSLVGIKHLVFRFSDWPHYVPHNFSTPSSAVDLDPQDITFELGRFPRSIDRI